MVEYPRRSRRSIVVIALFLATHGCSSPSTAEVPLEIRDIEVLDNPQNVLSCYVNWSTNRPATSRVEFGEEGDFRFFVEDEELTREHELLVIGMRAESTYVLRLVSTDAAGVETTSDDLSFETSELPFGRVRAEVTVHAEEAVQPGWTLANFVIGDSLGPVVVVMFDMGGEPVWYYEMGHEEGRADVEVSLLEDNVVLIGGAVPPEEHPIEVNLAGEIRRDRLEDVG